jgi:hypothetical protein
MPIPFPRRQQEIRCIAFVAFVAHSVRCCQEAKRLGESVQFGGLFAVALEDISGLNEELLFSFSKLLRLTLPQQLSLGLGLVQSVNSEVTQQEGAKFLKSKLNELNANNGGSVPPSIVQQLLFHLQTHDGFAKQKAAFVKIYRQLIPEVHAPVSLAPTLYNELPEVDSKRTYDPEVRASVQACVCAHLPSARPRVYAPEYSWVCTKGFNKSGLLRDIISPVSKHAPVALLCSLSRRTLLSCASRSNRRCAFAI